MGLPESSLSPAEGCRLVAEAVSLGGDWVCTPAGAEAVKAQEITCNKEERN